MMMKYKNKDEMRKDLLQGFCAALYIFPLSLCVGVLSGVGVFGGTVAGVVGCLLNAFGGVSFAPCWMLFMPSFFVIKEFGTGFAFASMLIGAILYAVLQTVLHKKQIQLSMTDSAVAGLAVGVAFLATVILTKDYFGIAASGNTVMDMLRSYRSNGFHANWRGVLYGTITLVIMITWPRKFRTFKKYVPAPFAALVVPLVINMLLNYEAYRTPVYETGAYSVRDLTRLFDFSANTHAWWYLPVVGIGFCVCFFTATLFRKQIFGTAQAASHLLTSAVCLPLAPYEFSSKSLLGGIVGAVTVVLLSVCFPLVSRMPTHSMAVVLITLGWQSVPWGKIKSSFQGGVKEILSFVLCFVCFVAADPVLAFLPPFVSVLDSKKRNNQG